MKFLNEVIEKLTEAGSYNRQDFAPPAVILWPDEERQWEGLILRLEEKLPHFRPTAITTRTTGLDQASGSSV